MKPEEARASRRVVKARRMLYFSWAGMVLNAALAVTLPDAVVEFSLGFGFFFAAMVINSVIVIDAEEREAKASRTAKVRGLRP